MKYGALFLSLTLLLQSSAFAAKKSKEKVKTPPPEEKEHDYFPCLNNGNMFDKDFLKSLGDISNRELDCDESMDPRWQAKLYIANMRKIMQDMSLVVSNAANDFVDDKQSEDHVLLAQDVKAMKEPINPLLDYTIKTMGFAEKANPSLKPIKTGLDVLNLSIGILKKARAKAPDYDHAASVTSFRTIRGMRDDLVVEVQNASHAFFDIEVALDKAFAKGKFTPEEMKLSPENHEILRNVICRFMPQDGKSSKFCSSAHGGDDYNDLRKTASCKDINMISDKNRDREKRRLTAIFARSLAETVKMKDPSPGPKNNKPVMPDGMLSHIEITFTQEESKSDGYDKVRTIEKVRFNSPGGQEVLCKLLKDPKYDKYRTPNGFSNDFKMSELGLPVNYIRKHYGSKLQFAWWTVAEDISTFKIYTDAKGKPQRYQVNHYPSSGNVGNVHEGPAKNLETFKDLKDGSVNAIIGTCK